LQTNCLFKVSDSDRILRVIDSALFIETSGRSETSPLQVKVIKNDPGFLPDQPQNWITGSLCHSRLSLKISERSVHNFLS